MTQKDFWHNSKVACIGAGSWGTVLANLAGKNAQDVRVWTRNEEQARTMNATRMNPKYVPDMLLTERVHTMTDLERVFGDGVQMVIWALPSGVCRDEAKRLARFFRGNEVVLHATKGIESGTLKRITEVLREELPCTRIGVISGPNLAAEVARGEPAAAVVASSFDECVEAGKAILTTDRFRIYGAKDVVGVEWAGTLKNVLAIASGALDALKFGWNARAMLITRGLAEMVRFGVAMGAKESTFLGLAGAGDLLATCSSPLSRNYRVGFGLAQGRKLADILVDLKATAEGVRTTRIVWEFASANRIDMPITEAVYQLLEGQISVEQALAGLMTRPSVPE